jgi:hypothetical protein
MLQHALRQLSKMKFSESGLIFPHSHCINQGNILTLLPGTQWILEAVLTILTLRLAQLSDKHPSPAVSATAAKFGALRSSVPTEALEPGPDSLTGSKATPVNGDQESRIQSIDLSLDSST